MVGFDLRIERFTGRVPCPFPAVAQRRQVLPNRLGRDLEAEFIAQDLWSSVDSAQVELSLDYRRHHHDPPKNVHD